MHSNSSIAVLCWGYSSSILCISYLDFPHFHSVAVLNTRTPQSGRHEYTSARRHIHTHTHTAAQHLEGIKQLRHWLDTPEPRREGGIDSKGGGRSGKQGVVERVGVYRVSKACWEKKEQRNGWRKQASGVGVGGENITQTEPGCKCLRTCPLGWSEWQREIDGEDRSENVVCAHCQRGFNTPVCGQGVKTCTHTDIPPSLYIHTHRHMHSTHIQNLRIDLFWDNQNSTHNRTYMKRRE